MTFQRAVALTSQYCGYYSCDFLLPNADFFFSTALFLITRFPVSPTKTLRTFQIWLFCEQIPTDEIHHYPTGLTKNKNWFITMTPCKETQFEIENHEIGTWFSSASFIFFATKIHRNRILVAVSLTRGSWKDFFNPLTPTSDQESISPDNIN